MTEDIVLTKDQFMQRYNVLEDWIQKNTQAKRIPGQFKVGKSWRYPLAEIQKNILKTGQLLLKKEIH